MESITNLEQLKAALQHANIPYIEYPGKPLKENERYKKLNECPQVAKLAKFKLSRCPKGMFWNTLCSP